MEDDIKSLVETGTFRIPKVECWFPADIPLSAVEGVLLVHVVRRPYDPHSLEALLSDLGQSAADERFKEVQRAMPALIAEMKEDLAREKFVREFVVLPTKTVGYSTSHKVFSTMRTNIRICWARSCSSSARATSTVVPA